MELIALCVTEVSRSSLFYSHVMVKLLAEKFGYSTAKKLRKYQRFIRQRTNDIFYHLIAHIMSVASSKSKPQITYKIVD